MKFGLNNRRAAVVGFVLTAVLLYVEKNQISPQLDLQYQMNIPNDTQQSFLIVPCERRDLSVGQNIANSK